MLQNWVDISPHRREVSGGDGDSRWGGGCGARAQAVAWTLFLSANPLAADVALTCAPTRPYRQTLESLRDELESLLLVKLNRLTSGSLTVITDNYHTRRLGTGQIAAITDDLMGVIFDKLTPFSANFIKLNDYSLRVYSLNALRVLYQRYASFYTKEEFDFMVHMIRTIYPPERYAAWLKE